VEVLAMKKEILEFMEIMKKTVGGKARVV